jgi:hypothetical protein
MNIEQLHKNLPSGIPTEISDQIQVFLRAGYQGAEDKKLPSGIQKLYGKHTTSCNGTTKYSRHNH